MPLHATPFAYLPSLYFKVGDGNGFTKSSSHRLGYIPGVTMTVEIWVTQRIQILRFAVMLYDPPVET